MSLEFFTTVTLNRQECHLECYWTQLNAYMQDTTDTSKLWKDRNGGPANPKTGECGKEKKWGYCSKAKDKAGQPTSFTKAVSTYDWKTAVTNAIAAAVHIGESQSFQDGNHRTALEEIFDSLNYQGLNIKKFDLNGRPEVDGFGLYVQLKSLTEDVGKWTKADTQGVKKEMYRLLKDVVQIRGVTSDERNGLAEFVKVRIPAELEGVDALGKELMVIRMDTAKCKGKAGAQAKLKEYKRSDVNLYNRYIYMYGEIN